MAAGLLRQAMRDLGADLLTFAWLQALGGEHMLLDRHGGVEAQIALVLAL